jgi:predicted PurR-regulated permease PerM
MPSMNTPSLSDQGLKRSIVIIVSLSLLLIVFLWGLGNALIPLLLSFALSYLVFPVIQKLERFGIQRSFAIIVICVFLLLTFLVTIALILPSLIQDTKNLFQQFPEYSVKAIQNIDAVLLKFGFELDLSTDAITEFIKRYLTQFSSALIDTIQGALKSSVSGVAAGLLSLLNFFLIPLFFFYVINDYEKISEELKSYIPLPARAKLQRFLSLTNEVLSGYIRGQLLVASVLAVLYAIGLSIVGLPFGVLIGLLSGLISVIPYAGVTLGLLTALIVALANFTGIGPIIGIVSVFAIVQLLEGFVITPKLVGDKVGLSSLATMLALIIGGNLLGFMGMLIAIPIAAIMKTVLLELKSEYQNLDLYRGNKVDQN